MATFKKVNIQPGKLYVFAAGHAPTLIYILAKRNAQEVKPASVKYPVPPEYVEYEYFDFAEDRNFIFSDGLLDSLCPVLLEIRDSEIIKAAERYINCKRDTLLAEASRIALPRS